MACTVLKVGIFTTKDLNMVTMEQFVKKTWQSAYGRHKISIDIDVDIMLKAVSKELDKVLVYCESNSLPVLIGADQLSMGVSV
jgi:hypothetical protein